MDRPAEPFTTIWDESLKGIRDSAVHSRLVGMKTQANAASDAYILAAQTQTYASIDRTGGMAVTPFVRDDLNSLYSSGLVGRKDGRRIYDRLKLAAPDGICPMCGDRAVENLDHHLPKTKYPALSVAPDNLIPCCRDCNTDKGDKMPTSEGATFLNPYFDRPNTGRWLVAEVMPGPVPSTLFRVQPLASWNSILALRVEHHFAKLKLASYYSKKAARLHSSKRKLYANLVANVGPSAVRSHIEADAESAIDARLNAWEAATYTGWASSDWYCTIGCALS